MNINDVRSLILLTHKKIHLRTITPIDDDIKSLLINWPACPIM